MDLNQYISIQDIIIIVIILLYLLYLLNLKGQGEGG